MKKIILLLLVLFLLSCDTTRQAMQSWTGQTKVALFRTWGAPQQTSSDGQGGEILTYTDDKTVYVPVSGMVVQRNITHFADFYINPNGVIYYSRWGRR